MRKFVVMLFVLVPTFLQIAAAQSDPPLLLRFPAVSKTQIVFNYAGDLWTVSRDGGDAHRLTSDVGIEILPHFSPDGSMIAFTGEYDGNRDVYLIPATGGLPRRLTYHPAEEYVNGWTPDGKKILFNSWGSSFMHFEDQLYSVPVDGGFPTQLPIPIAEDASFSPDGTHVAYVPHPKWQAAWKRYHGGQTTPIWILDLKDSSTVKIPRDNSNDEQPMWVGDTVYFLSDRNGPVSLFAYDTKTKQVSEALHSDGLDFKGASAGPDAIVIEQFGAIKLYDLNTHQAKNISIHVTGDIDAIRPHFSKVDPKRIQNFSLSPTGARAVFEAWGEIFTVPTDKGDIRNLTRTPAVADRDPAWSPDGKSIAYFSDESGEYELTIRDQNGLGTVRHINLGNPPSFFYSPTWSPDSKKIAYSDKRLQLWYVDLENPAPKLIDADYFGGFGPTTLNQTWSPDSKWVSYTRSLPSGQHAVFVYSLEQAKAFQVTDGMSDALYPSFDKNGKYLYFTASTDVALTSAGLDMSSDEHRVSRAAYVAVLSKDEKSPLAPESDEEKAKDEKKPDQDKDKAKDKDQSKEKGKDKDKGKDKSKADDKSADKGKDDKDKDKDKDKKEEPVVVKIDIDAIGQRILSLPIPSKNYVNMVSGKSGILFLSEAPLVITEDDQPLSQTIQKFDLSKRKVDKFMDEVNDFTISADGEKILYRKGDSWSTASADDGPGGGGPPKPGIGPLKLDGWEVYVEPRAMWKQIYNETWRIERDFFYDPHYHGLDLDKAKKKYAPYLDGIASRAELTYLFEECLGELTVGHMFVGGGETPEPKKLKGGLLGADYSLENNRYRVAKVYDGENWNPGMQAPLTQPGVNVKTGDYILAVNGRDLHASDNIYSFFEETAGKQVLLKVGANPDGKDSRDVTVVPVESEEGLRHLAWIESNRRRVDQATGGRVAYVHVPNTAGAGYTSFNRYFFSQVGKDAAIIDERFNEGGQLADYIVDHLRRPMMSKVVTREGHDWSSPSEAIYGPKVMIINEMSGSGGDALPWYFRKAGIGPLIGKKTWGGLVGIGGYPELLDGGRVTAPRAAIYGINGEWEVENHGVAPDVEVDLEPATWKQGHDAQLEKAIEVVMQQLKDHPLPEIKRPAYPNYHEHDDLGAK
ncbi:MAG TPA: PDZ domain-containing protein [Candidatus Sulfotelmatobacter sp.]|jgi:tricorn protease|nr:PDZ domain-containing protein [Candidatus Sulfotelmatobacter sp.]